MRGFLSILTVLALTPVAATPAAASWPQGGVVVATPLPQIFPGFGEAVLLTAPDGSVVALGSGTTSTSQYWGSQRVTPSGDLTPVWPGLLEPYTTSTTNSTGILSHMGIGFSSAGDLFTSWSDGGPTIRSQRIADWASNAPTLEDRAFVNPLGKNVGFARLAPALGSDVYYYYGGPGAPPRLMRRTAVGGVSPGWPVNGKRAFPPNVADGAMLPDGSGGVIVSARTTGFEFRVMRINADTTFGAGWTGLALSSNCSYSDEQDFPQLLASGADGYLACWSNLVPATTPPTRNITIMRFLATGTTDEAWPPEGVQITYTSSSSSDPRFAVLPDGVGGAFVLFQRDDVPRGTHILANGTLDPGLAGTDVPLLDPAAQYVISGATQIRRIPLVAAPGKNGGLVFVWVDDRDAPQRSLRARWLTSTLAPDPTEPATPRRIPTHSATFTNVRAAISDGLGGLYVAWGDLPGDDLVVMMDRVLASEYLAAPPQPRATSLALSAPRPNPARGSVALDVTLPDESPARVELLDVAGRVVRSQVVQGAGAHTIAFADLASLAPGLYFARATTHAAATSARVVVGR